MDRIERVHRRTIPIAGALKKRPRRIVRRDPRARSGAPYGDFGLLQALASQAALKFINGQAPASVAV